jgi:hypothetical protein
MSHFDIRLYNDCRIMSGWTTPFDWRVKQIVDLYMSGEQGDGNCIRITQPDGHVLVIEGQP